MTNAIRINHLNKEILISKSFAKAAMNANSVEYKDLAEVMSKHPDYKISQRIIKKNPNKETYAGLTYEYMRDYIILHSTPEEELDAVSEFNELILVSKCHSKSKRYPIIKKWFLAKYPNADDFGIATVAAAAKSRLKSDVEEVA